MSVELRNPHSVLAVLNTRPEAVLSLEVARESAEAGWQDVLDRAHALGIRPLRPGRSHDPRVSGGLKRGDGRQTRARAVVDDKPLLSLAEVWEREQITPEGHDVWLALEHIQDPHNLGAILRTAAFFGVRAVFLTRDRSAPLSSTVYDVAAGGVESLTLVEVTNLARALERAKERGLWILGTSEHANRELGTIAPDRNWMVVMGNEQEGLRRLTLDQCDDLVQIAPRGGVTSLNVSVAAGVVLSRLCPASDH